MANPMTWEQKFAALCALGECSLKMRKPGDWYVLDRIELAHAGGLRSPTEAASCPERAVEEHWRQLVEDAPIGSHLRLSSGRRVDWNGFMWVDVELPAGGAS